MVCKNNVVPDNGLLAEDIGDIIAFVDGKKDDVDGISMEEGKVNTGEKCRMSSVVPRPVH